MHIKFFVLNKLLFYGFLLNHKIEDVRWLLVITIFTTLCSIFYTNYPQFRPHHYAPLHIWFLNSLSSEIFHFFATMSHLLNINPMILQLYNIPFKNLKINLISPPMNQNLLTFFSFLSHPHEIILEFIFVLIYTIFIQVISKYLISIDFYHFTFLIINNIY